MENWGNRRVKILEPFKREGFKTSEMNEDFHRHLGERVVLKIQGSKFA